MCVFVQLTEHDGMDTINWAGCCKGKETFDFLMSLGLLSRHLQHF